MLMPPKAKFMKNKLKDHIWRTIYVFHASICHKMKAFTNADLWKGYMG